MASSSTSINFNFWFLPSIKQSRKSEFSEINIGNFSPGKPSFPFLSFPAVQHLLHVGKALHNAYFMSANELENALSFKGGRGVVFLVIQCEMASKVRFQYPKRGPVDLSCFIFGLKAENCMEEGVWLHTCTYGFGFNPAPAGNRKFMECCIFRLFEL